MKASKVISLLFSLAQVIFILKLIEYAQAVEVHTNSNNSNKNNPVTEATFQPLTSIPGLRQAKALDFVTGPRRKRVRTRIPVRSSDVLTTKPNAKVDSKGDQAAGRNCPACATGECNSNAQEFAIPVLQLKVAVAVIAIWLAIFFKVWKYPLVKPDRPTGYPEASGGYGGYSGGYSVTSSPAPVVDGGYGGYGTVGGYGGGDATSDTSTGSLLDNVFKAFEKFSQS